MPTLSEAYRAQPVHRLHHLHHPDHFDLESVREVPDSHAWPRLDDYPTSNETVPIVDLSSPGVLNHMSDACEKWGAFQVTGHGFPVHLLNRMESECQRLFSLPVQQKLSALRSPDGIGGYGLARISSFFSKLMWSEGFTVVGSPVEHARKLWPNDYHQFCEVIEEYKREMGELAGKIMRLILASLGLTEKDVSWSGEEGDGFQVASSFSSSSSSVLQLNSYPSCPDPDRAMGLAAHTDSSLFTVLYQKSTSGLQVLRTGANRGQTRWVTVPPMLGALVVNVGDLLQILSNGRYHSVLHRAVVNRTHHRVSIAYLHGPPVHAKISPVDKLTGPGRPSAYRSVTWPEYLGLKAKYFDAALISLKARDKETWDSCSNNKTSRSMDD